MAPLAVLDADVLIGHLDSRDAQHERATDLLATLAMEGVRLHASTITLAEVLVGPAKANRDTEAVEALNRLAVAEVAIGPGEAGRLAWLRAKTGCRMPDCCVLLAAQVIEATLLCSFDDRLRRAAEALEIPVDPETSDDRSSDKA